MLDGSGEMSFNNKVYFTYSLSDLWNTSYYLNVPLDRIGLNKKMKIERNERKVENANVQKKKHPTNVFVIAGWREEFADSSVMCVVQYLW